VAAAVGESAAKVSADIGAVPNMNRKWFKIVLFNNFLKPEKYFNTLKKNVTPYADVPTHRVRSH
jgi:hypothetical protein